MATAAAAAGLPPPRCRAHRRGRRRPVARWVVVAAAANANDAGTKRDRDLAERARAQKTTYAAVERAWRDGGALDGANDDAVERTVRRTLQLAKHFERLRFQQEVALGKYGEGVVLPASHSDPIWLASRLRVLSRLTRVAPEELPAMVEIVGADLLALSPAKVMRVVVALKDLLPIADASSMIAAEPELLVVADERVILYSGMDAMQTLRGMDIPEPCVRLLLAEEPGLMLGKGGLVRLDQIREQAETHAENLRSICDGVRDDEPLDVNAQRWFTNFFCGYY